MECFVALLSGMGQLFNISLHADCSCLGLWSGLSYISMLSILYSMQILIVSVLTDKLYSNYAIALYKIAN